MRLSQTDQSSGRWVSTPGVITPGSTGVARIESHGFMTGAEGHISYTLVGSSGVLKLWVNVPFSGTDGYNVDSIPSGTTETHSGIDGHNARVSVTLS